MHIPNLNCVVIAATSKEVTIWTECDRPDPTTMTIQGFEALSCMRTPEFNGAICTDTSKEVLLPTVGDRVNNSATLETISLLGWAAMT